MITIPRKRVAVIPVFDAEESRGGIIKPSSFVYYRKKEVFKVFSPEGKQVDEAEDIERARYLVDRYNRRNHGHYYQRSTTNVEDQPLDAGERCDQGVVKYVGADVKEVKIGDYVFFSGYTGTLVNVEGEGRLIILPEKFIEFTMNLDNFLIIPGLYFKDSNGKFFEANYETSMNLIAQTFTDLNLTLDVTPSKPKLEDYDVDD